MNAIDILDQGILRLEPLFKQDFTVTLLNHDEAEHKGSIGGTLRLNGKEYPCLAITHRGIAPIRNLNAHWKREKKQAPLFFVPSLNSAERSACQQEGIQFVDTHGNCYIDLSGCHAIVSQEHEGPNRPLPTGKAFQAGGLRFLLAVYSNPELLNKPYREISEKTGISTGALSAIFEDLRANGFLLENEETRSFVLTNELELTRRFAYAYLVDIRPKLRRGLFYMAAPDVLDRLKKAMSEDQVLMGGQHAATIRGDYLYSPTFNLYTDVRIVDLAKQYGIVPVGANLNPNQATVEVFNTFGGQYAGGQVGGISLVNDLLIYADLLNSHDVRVLDAAERLLTNEIFNNFGKNWLRYNGTPGILSTS